LRAERHCCDGSSMSFVSRLNHQTSLFDRLGRKLRGASRLDVAVAFARATGTDPLLRLGLPPSTRFVVGLGFAITEPAAIEALADAGAEVRLVFVRPEIFHPKLYLITRPGELVVFSGSGNLTGGGLDTNIEQYEELTVTAAASRIQRARFTALWELGEPFVASSAAWKHYRARHGEIARARAEIQRKSVALTTAVAQRTRTASSGTAPRAQAQEPVRAERRAQIAARRGGQLSTRELHELLTTPGASRRVAVTGRVDGTTQMAWLERLARAYPTVVLVNYAKVRDLDALIDGTHPSTSTGRTKKRRNARADDANWIPFADADKLPGLQRAGGSARVARRARSSR